MPIKLLQHKDEESRVISKLLPHFGWEKNECFPNVMVFPWESDLLVLTDSGYVTEVEVKISLGDWKADPQKSKFNNHSERGLFERSVKRFYYAVPAPLYSKYAAAPFELPAGAGILVLGGWGKAQVYEQQPAKTNVNAKAIPEALRKRLQRSIYFRFMRQAVKGGVRLDLQPA